LQFLYENLIGQIHKVSPKKEAKKRNRNKIKIDTKNSHKEEAGKQEHKNKA
jgi:hypothetical protein